MLNACSINKHVLIPRGASTRFDFLSYFSCPECDSSISLTFLVFGGNGHDPLVDLLNQWQWLASTYLDVPP